MPNSINHFGIIGAGAWGTALALAVLRAGKKATLWARSPDLATVMLQTRQNQTHLPGITLPPNLHISADLADIQSCGALILAVPAQHLRATCKLLAGGKARPILIAAKGIEHTHYRLMSEIVAELLPQHPVYILSGPSFASEVARDMPTALTLASEHEGAVLAQNLSSPSFRLYTTDDIIGTQIGGAIKNVLAIACGIVTGKGLGDNARAALITRGLAEIIRLGHALGARPETLMGLSGFGDVVLTCSSPQSRNMSLGIALGQGKSLEEIMASRQSVTEGVTTATSALGLARRHGVDMPVVSAVDLILRDKASIDDCITGLLSRPLRHEAI